MKIKLLPVLPAIFSIILTGCVTEKEVVYKRISFSDTNGVHTTIYYPKKMEQDLRTPHDDERWKYVAAKDASDDGKAKPMTVKP